MPEFENVSNIFLVYPPYAGGNHLVNLISTCPKVEPSFLTASELKKQMQERNRLYNITDASLHRRIHHFNETVIPDVPPELYANTGRVLFDETFNVILQQQSRGYISIIQGHIQNWWGLINDPEGRIHKLENYVWMFLTWPKKDPALKRITEHTENTEQTIPSGLYPDIDFDGDYCMYDLPSFRVTDVSNQTKEMFNIQPNKRVMIDTDKFFSDDGFDYIASSMKGFFDIELHPHLGYAIHNLWLENIQ